MAYLPKPIFLFSLPRSGSTLLQRILASHPAISTVPEPWLLLPYLYTTRQRGIFTEYSHAEQHKALCNFYKQLPCGKKDYLDEIRQLSLRLYAKAAEKNSIYFLDKTPRYHLIINEIIDLFSNGKFIFLWRNPLSVCTSMQETWAKGKWNLYNYNIDLYTGLEKMLATYENKKGNVHSLCFENLISKPDIEIAKLFSYLELGEYPYAVTNFKNIKLKSKMGDPTGTEKYSQISTAPLQKWKQTIKNPLRKLWYKKYLIWIGKYRLQLMGYDLDILLQDLKETEGLLDHLFSDLARMTIGCCSDFIEPYIFRQKLNATLNKKRLHYHM